MSVITGECAAFLRIIIINNVMVSTWLAHINWRTIGLVVDSVAHLDQIEADFIISLSSTCERIY